MQFKSSIFSFFFVVILSLVFFGFWFDQLSLNDPEGLIAFSNEVLTGALFSSEKEPSWYTVTNAPAYPLLLSIIKGITDNYHLAGWLINFFFLVLASFCLTYRFAKHVGSGPIALLILISFFVWRENYFLLQTDWISLCSILVFLSFVPQNYEECTPVRLFLLGLILSCLILIKPILLSALIVVSIIVAFVVRTEEKRKIAVGILLGLFPVFIWCLFNSYRIGSFTPAAFLGHSLFGTVTSIGHAEFDDNEMPDLVRFSEYINKNKIPQPGQEVSFINKLPGIYSSIPYRHNIYKVALQFESEKTYPAYYYNTLMFSYAKRVILDNPLSYIRLVLAGLNSLLRDVWLLLVSILMLVMMLKSGHELSLVLGAALGTHFLNVLLLSAAAVVGTSGYLLTMIPLGFVSVLSIIAVIRRSL